MIRFYGALLGALVFLAGVIPAAAQAPLRDIGNHPFTGTHREACELHVNAHGLFTMQECMAAIVQSDDVSTCPERAVLQDGTTWWMTFTRDGEHRIGLYTIAFGDDVSVDDPKRMANDCTGVAGAEGFIWPHACGNYAVPGQSTPRQTTQRTPTPVTPRQSTVVNQIPRGSSLMNSGGMVQIFNVGGVYAYCRP